MAERSKIIDPDVQKWLNHFGVYDKEFDKWTHRVERILKRYRDDNRSERNQSARFNILWSNVQTLVPAVFARMPRPEVTRRFHDNDPVGRVASLLMERALDYEVQHYPDYRATMRQDVYDRFLGGRGTAWIRYEPHMRAPRLQLPQDGVEITEDTDEPAEELDYECAPVDYVHWKDFGHTVVRTWEEVSAVWRCVYLTKQAVEDRFGEKIAKRIPMDARPDEISRQTYGSSGEERERARIYEIWDKTEKKTIWLSKGIKEILDEQDDPLGLEEFFPCPRPLFATLTNESLIPVPDFTLYQDQARELDILCDRIDGLVKALQVKGIYDAEFKELGRLFKEAENTDLIPVKNWAAFSEKNGLKGSIDLVDLDPIGRALKEAYLAFEQVKNQVYEITGISDIIRGETNAQETATAQQIKGQYASLRLKNMQADVAQFASELIQMKAQVICNKFAPQTFLQISAAEQLAPEDRQLIMPAMQLLFGERIMNADAPSAPNPMRSFRIEVASDSMIQIDEAEEKESRNQFLTATAGFLKNLEPIMVQMPPLAPIVMEMLKFTVQGYKAGRVIEGKFDQVVQQLTQMAQQPKPPSPEEQKAQAEMQKMQAELKAKQEEHAMTIKADGEKHAQEMQMQQQKHALEMKNSHEQAMMDRKNQNMQAQDEMRFKRQEMAMKAPETAPVDAEGNAAASPMMKMAEQMTQAMQLMAQVAEMMQQQMGMARKLIRDPQTGEKMSVPVPMRMQ